MRRLEESTVARHRYQRRFASLEQGRRVRSSPSPRSPQARLGHAADGREPHAARPPDEAAVTSDTCSRIDRDARPDQQVWRSGSQALCRWRAGRSRGPAWARAARYPRRHAVYELRSRLQRRAGGHSSRWRRESRSVVRDHLLALARSATSDVARFAHIFRSCGRTRLARHLQDAGLPGAARAWRKAIEVAEGMQLPYDAALARLTPEPLCARFAEVRGCSPARDTFARLGATHDLAQVGAVDGVSVNSQLELPTPKKRAQFPTPKRGLAGSWLEFMGVARTSAGPSEKTSCGTTP